jgi:hypothetical protein
MWVVVKSLKSQSYMLSEGDLIRLGRMVLVVRKTDSETKGENKQAPIYTDEI